MRARILWPLGVCLVTAAYAAVPLLASHWFYMRGDTAVQFAPTWYHLGQLVRSGTWPPWLDPGSWAGGNYAAEALFGIYNPLNILIWLLVSAAPSLIVSVTLVKAGVLVMIALGAYLVALEYGAARWAAAAVAVALPFSGFTLFWDAGSWASGLIAFAYMPWTWWAFRRTLRGAMNPFWAFLVGALAITQGNPYGTLAVVAVGLGMVAEGVATRNTRGLLRVVVTGVCVAAFLPLVYLPLLESSQLAARSGHALFFNTGKLRPELGQLLGLSGPTYVPTIKAITGPMRVPATYFAWFVVPLLPWLRYDVVRRRARELAGVGVVAAIYLLLTVGPSELWLFRWPLRLVEYLYLAVGVAFAVVLSQGLHRDRWRLRGAITGALVLFIGYLSWAEDPRWAGAALGGPALLALLTGAVLLWHRRGSRAPALLTAILVLGTGVVIVAQATTFGENESSRLWHLPGNVSDLQRRFAGLEGETIQFADFRKAQNKHQDLELRAAWDHYLPGSMFHVAGVEAVNNYTGMGYKPFEKTLCLHYEGFTKACGYQHFWQPLATGEPSLADLMKVQTVIVKPQLAQGVLPAPGWTVDKSPKVLTLHRSRPLPWPGSRLSYVTPGVRVAAASTEGAYHERARLRTGAAGGTAVFAMLDWPGYTATFDGRPVTGSPDEAGLLTVALPAHGSGALEVSYRPPGLALGLAAAALGTAGAALLGVLALLGRRRRRRTDAEAPAEDRAEAPREPVSP